MARRGRKRKDGARTPSGRLSRAGQPSAEEKIMSVVMDQRRRLGVRKDHLRDSKLEAPLGILCYFGIITAMQMEAGEAYAKDVAAFRWSYGIPSPHAKSADLSDVRRGVDNREMDREQIDRIRRRYQDAWRALDDTGREAMIAVNDTAVHQRGITYEQVTSLQRGLDTLVHHYGLTRRRKSA